ncbi:MAG: hypothetical protein ACE5I9_05705 [Candidatus Methylomirabilales bacterium]
MRRIATLVGVFLLVFPFLAFGQVKVRTRTGGYPKWDIPPGARRAKGFKAPVKAGPFTLGFHTQIEVDFESNNQFDFDDSIADGQVNNGVAAANAAVGLGVPPATQRGESFQTEFRFGMDAVSGPITTHVIMEQTDGPIRDRNSENFSFNVERAWGDVDIGIANIRYGIELFSLEPTLMLYGDDDPMLRVYKNYGSWAWNVIYMKRRDADEERRGNIGGATTGSGLLPGDVNTSSNREGTSNDVDVVMVSFEFPFANPFGPGVFSFQPIYVLDHDKRFQTPGVRVGGQDFDGTIVVHYFGANVITNFGPIKAVISGFFATGEDDTGFNSVNSATGLPQNDVDVSAWQAFAEFAYPVPNTALTISVGAYLASGDDDPFDDDANAWLGVSHNSEIFNGRDIFVDKTEDGSELTIRLQSKAGVVRAGEAVRLSQDDEAIVQGLSSFNNVGTVASASALHPTRSAGAVAPTPGSAASALDPYSVNNRSHPGIAIANVALKYKLLPNLTATADYQHIRFMETEGFSPLTSKRKTVGILTRGGDIDGEFGNQVGLKFAWKVGKFMTFEPGFVALIPGDGIEDLTGEDDTAFSFRLGMRWNF